MVARKAVKTAELSVDAMAVMKVHSMVDLMADKSVISLVEWTAAAMVGQMAVDWEY